jgi:hypothetical protein
MMHIPSEGDPFRIPLVRVILIQEVYMSTPYAYVREGSFQYNNVLHLLGENFGGGARSYVHVQLCTYVGKRIDTNGRLYFRY